MKFSPPSYPPHRTRIAHKGRAGLPAFSWMVRIAARFLLRTDPELALYGRYVISRRLEEEGFTFQLPKLGDALHDLLRRDGK